jgi:hypothetical protein
MVVSTNTYQCLRTPAAHDEKRGGELGLGLGPDLFKKAVLLSIVGRSIRGDSEGSLCCR